jgi:hypothetical protein
VVAKDSLTLYVMSIESLWRDESDVSNEWNHHDVVDPPGGIQPLGETEL